MKVAFVSPQGTLVHMRDLYKMRQGETDEEGGQVGYVLNFAIWMAEAGCEIDIFARDYTNRNTWIETPREHKNLRIIHVPTSADPDIEKEQFYPYHAEFLANCIQAIRDHDLSYDVINGHYMADGGHIAMGMADFYEQEKGTRPLLAGTTHSLGHAKNMAIVKKLQSALKSKNKNQLRDSFAAEAYKFNILTRLGVEMEVIRHMDILFRVSGKEQKILTENYKYRGPIVLMPGGFDPEIFYPYTPSERQDTKSKVIKYLQSKSAGRPIDWEKAKIISGVGRLNEQKGIFQAVQAMKKILREHKDAVFVFAGGNIPPKKGEEKYIVDKCLHFAEQHGFADRIILTGKMSHTQIADLHNIADIALFPQLLEPYGMTIIEAAACGVPVIVSKEAGAAEDLTHGKHALHVNPFSPADIAKKVVKLLSDKNKAIDLGIEGAARASEFTWEQRTRHYIRALERVTDSPALKMANGFRDKRHTGSVLRSLHHAQPLKSTSQDKRTAETHALQILMRHYHKPVPNKP